MSLKGLTKVKLDELKEDGFIDEQIEKLNQREVQRIDDKLTRLTINILPHKEESCEKELRLVLLGKTGSGKSSTGNLILGKTVFKESNRSTVCTVTINEQIAKVDGVYVRLIDTPGFYDDGKNHSEIVTEIIKVIDSFSEGIHGFLFVFNGETYRFTEDQKRIFSMLENGLFGPNFLKCCFVIITHGNAMGDGLTDYLISQTGTPFGEIIKTLKNRVICVENSAEEDYFREEQGKQVVRLVVASEGAMYTNEAMQKHKQDALSKVDASIRTFVPIIEAEVIRLLSNKSQAEIKSLNDSDMKTMTQTVLDKLMNEIEAATLPKDKLLEAIEKILVEKQKMLTDTSVLEQFKDFILPLLVVAGQLLPDILGLVRAFRAFRT